MKRTLKIEFDTDTDALNFVAWMCDGGGEQHYWDAMECSGNDSVSFSYHGTEDETKADDDPERYGEFMCDWTIRTEKMSDTCCTPTLYDCDAT